MRRMFFSLVFSLLVAAVFGTINLGVKAGYNSSLSFSNLLSVTDGTYTLSDVKGEMWNNFQVGAFARFGMKKLYIQPEVLYSVQKKDFTLNDVLVGGSSMDVNTVLNVSTVEIPLYVGVKLLDFKVMNLRLFAGPKFIMDTGSKLEFSQLTNGDSVTPDDLVHEFKKASVDVEVGLGVDVFMFALDAKIQGIMDKVQAVQAGDFVAAGLPTSNFVISLAWKIL